MYREWSLSKTHTAENGEFKHEMSDEFIGSADDDSVLEMDDDPMDHIANNIELPIYTGIFEFLGFLLDDDDDDGEESQHKESETTRTSQQNETSRERGGGVDNEGERQDNNTSSQSSNEDFYPSSQNESDPTNKEILQDSLIMQREDRSDPLPRKERDMRLSVRGANKSSISLPVILDDSSKSSKASSMNSLNKMTEVQSNSSKPNAPVVTKERRVLSQKGPFKRNSISTLNTTAPRRKSLTKPKESRSGPKHLFPKRR